MKKPEPRGEARGGISEGVVRSFVHSFQSRVPNAWPTGMTKRIVESTGTVGRTSEVCLRIPIPSERHIGYVDSALQEMDESERNKLLREKRDEHEAEVIFGGRPIPVRIKFDRRDNAKPPVSVKKGGGSAETIVNELRALHRGKSPDSADMIKMHVRAGLSPEEWEKLEDAGNREGNMGAKYTMATILFEERENGRDIPEKVLEEWVRGIDY